MNPDIQKRIARYIDEYKTNGPDIVTTSDIMKSFGKTQGAAHSLLVRMCRRGQAIRVGWGKYRILEKAHA